MIPKPATPLNATASGAYDDYLRGDCADWSISRLRAVRVERPTAVLAMSSVAPDMVSAGTRDVAIKVLRNGGHYGFAIPTHVLAGEADADARATGFPTFLETLHRITKPVAARRLVYRRPAGEAPAEAIAYVGRV